MAAFFERTEIRKLGERLLGPGQGVDLTSRAGQELHAMLHAIDGVRPLGRGARYQLTERGRAFLARKLGETGGEQSWSGEAVLATLGGQLPNPVNGATLSGLWLRDCKASLSADQQARADALGIQRFGDEVIRLRTEGALSLRWQDGGHYRADDSLRMLGELALPERALARLQGIEWRGRQIVTVENKGAFVDYPLRAGELLLYVPGRNTTLARRVIPLLPATIPWAHFGDLDQRGLDIATGLADAISRPLALWLPDNLMDYLHHYGRPLSRRLEGQQGSRGKIPWEAELATALAGAGLAEVVTHLVANRLWLEQEVLVSARAWRSWPCVLARAGQ